LAEVLLISKPASKAPTILKMKDNSFPAEILFAAFKSGDEKAFSELFKRYYLVFCLHADKHPHFNKSSEEVVNDIFLNVWNKREAFNTLDDMLKYIYGAIKISGRANLRKFFLRLKLHKTVWKGLPQTTENGARLDNHEKMMAIFRHPEAQLSKVSQEVLIMSFIEGLSVGEIAEKLAISPENVSVIKHRAIQALKMFFEKTSPSFLWFLLLMAVFLK
jgi:RNA polymerase sigma factor (sigma-70 family)